MITVMIPALNEEAHLQDAVKNIIDAAAWVGGLVLDIIIVNDCSTDGTPSVIQKLEKEYSFVRSIHHKTNQGIGSSFIEAVHLAKYDKITIFAGDNNATPYLIRNLFKNYNKADLVITYVVNTEYRGRFRNLLSMLFSTIYTVVFDIHIKYINGNPVYQVSELKKLDLKSKSYSILAEINVKLLRKAITFYEVEGFVNPDVVKSAAIRPKNLLEVIMTFFRLIYEVYFKNRALYSAKARRVLIPGVRTKQEPTLVDSTHKPLNSTLN